MRLAGLVGLTAVAVALTLAGGVSARPAADDRPAAASTGAGTRAQHFAGTPVPDGARATPFALRDQNGRLVRLADQRGHLMLMAFLYTRCRDVCPIIATQLDAAARSTGLASDRVRVLAVSVDPKGDTPVAVRAYARRHHLGPEFHWLVGTGAQLAPVWHAFNIVVATGKADEVVHTAPVYLFDARGRPRVYYAPPLNLAAIQHDIRILLGS